MLPYVFSPRVPGKSEMFSKYWMDDSLRQWGEKGRRAQRCWAAATEGASVTMSAGERKRGRAPQERDVKQQKGRKG